MPDLSEWLKTSQVLCGRRESRADGCCSFGTGQPLREAAWRSPRLFYCGSVGLHCQISFRGTASRFKYFPAYSPAPVSLQLKELPSRAPTSVRAPRGRCSWPCPGRSRTPCRTSRWGWPQLSSNYCFCPASRNVEDLCASFKHGVSSSYNPTTFLKVNSAGFRDKHSGGSTSQCRTPGLRSPVWSSDPLVRGKNLCNRDYSLDLWSLTQGPGT